RSMGHGRSFSKTHRGTSSPDGSAVEKGGNPIMKLTIHRGTHEIGGNCLEISSDNSRIILDIGLPLFNEDREPHDTGALRRQSWEELRQSGVLPSVPGLFDDGPTVDAILL